jgi:hypothetical protein
MQVLLLPLVPPDPPVPPPPPAPASLGQHSLSRQVWPAAHGEDSLQDWVEQALAPFAQIQSVTHPFAFVMGVPPHQLHGGTVGQVPPLVPPVPPVPLLPAFPPWPPEASTTPPSAGSAQSTVLHPQDVAKVWHLAPTGQVTLAEDRASPATTPIRVYPPGQASMLQQTLELPPAPALAEEPALAVDFPPWPTPPPLITPPDADAPPEPPATGASRTPPPLAPPEAPVLPAAELAPASGDLPSSCVPPPQPTSTVAVIKLTVSRSQCVFIMSRLVGQRGGDSHGPSKIKALRRAR